MKFDSVSIWCGTAPGNLVNLFYAVEREGSLQMEWASLKTELTSLKMEQSLKLELE